MDIINTVEEVNMVKIHSQIYFQSQVESTFSVEYGLQGNLFVMLYIDDEMKVEQFELIDPRGEKNIFAHFDTGSVYFSVTNVSDVGVWTYRVKLYDNVDYPAHGVSVDVSSSVSDGVMVTTGVSPDMSQVTQQSLPVIVHAHVHRSGDPVIGRK